MDTWQRTREVANWLNLSTPAGLVLAGATGCQVARAKRGIWLARGYSPRLPLATAFTVGNVVFLRGHLGDAPPDPRLLAHEETHATQYALCLGLPFLPLYFAAAGYSWLRTADPASRNLFERFAGLEAGGYLERPPRPVGPVLAAGVRRGLGLGPAPRRLPASKGTPA